jgi:two-component system, chemotaxis family, CheB/CheR fusion protein
MNTPVIKRIKNKSKSQLRVLGIGASAGGLEALQIFFKNLPPDTNAAYVVVQHLSPDYKSMMDELLARYTNMPIQVIKDGIKVEANTIYLIPPRQNLEIFNDHLFLTNLPGKGLNLPIDIFFRSLAEEKGKDAIGIILSGTGSDGTMGTRAIKELDGMVMVQDEKTAKFNGMPTSAISTGLVDYILPPEEMGRELKDYMQHPLVNKKQKPVTPLPEETDSFTKVLMILKNHSGTDFSYYKENTILRRLERRISINRFNSIDDYIPFLLETDKEKNTLYREFLIGVTRFFRDKEAFNVVRETVLPELISQNKEQIRIWSTGCSTGEEAYSIAILLLEAAQQLNFRGDIKIFASDIDRRAIETASYGYYTDSILADVDNILLAKYFTRTGDGYQINKEVRNIIVFAPHNLLKDPPFSKIDLLVCRNLFIYLKPDIQLSLLHRFYYSLNPGGVLFMGNSETLGGMTDAFDVVDHKNKIYRYKSGFKLPIIDTLMVDPKRTSSLVKTKLPDSSHKTVMLPDELLFSVINDFVPPSVIIDSNYYVVKVINNINPFTEIQTGNYSNDLFSILPRELGLFVNNLLRQLKTGKEKLISRSLTGLESLTGQTVQVEARKINYDDRHYFMLTFSVTDKTQNGTTQVTTDEVNYSDEIDHRILNLEKDLKNARENLAATIEELESANEELQSSNEELIASNEELQSTNEELQSVNEELYTVNTEHQQKIEELTRLNNDVNNLLKNLEVGAIYLDSKLCIRKITPYASQITNLLESDIGRPVFHLSILDNYPELPHDIQKVNETLQTNDKEIHDKTGKVFFARIRPYRTEHNAVDGVLVTLVEITELNKLKKNIKSTNERLANSLNLGNMAWWEWEINTGLVKFSDKKATMLGYTKEEFPSDVVKITELIHPDDYEHTMNEMQKVLDGNIQLWNVRYRIKRKDGNYAWYHDQGSVKLRDENGKPLILLGLVIDISEIHSLEEDLNKNAQLLTLIMKNNPTTIVMVDSVGKLTFANNRAEKLFNITAEQIKNRNYNSAEWEITSLNGNPVSSEELPFSVIKNTRKPLYGYKHYIKIPPNEKILLNIDGAPVISNTGEFQGAVFNIKVE